MHADLERLIALQRLDSRAADARRRIALEPERHRELDARLAAIEERLATSRQQLTDSQAARRSLEKDVAVHQTRLSKFRDQLMAVKTNVEYQAMQKEIAFAQGEVRTLEDRILERMLEGDELAAAVKRAESDLATERKAIEGERKTLETEVADLNASLEAALKERQSVAAALDPRTLTLFETVARRGNGVAMAEAREGICTICHVRLRPQVFNTIRRNDELIQCDSCLRILYFIPTPSPAGNVAQSPA
jgi:predicted  nucleic acid-binding Zn-ribbon protein